MPHSAQLKTDNAAEVFCRDTHLATALLQPGVKFSGTRKSRGRADRKEEGKDKEEERYPEDECVRWRSRSGSGAERRLCILNELDVSVSTAARTIALPPGALPRSPTGRAERSRKRGRLTWTWAPEQELGKVTAMDELVRHLETPAALFASPREPQPLASAGKRP